MVTIENIRKSFGQLQAVDDISLEIKAGECLGLLGPNGAGKTTTISMLTGLLPPDRGRILIDGLSPTDSSTRKRLGVAPQALAIYNELTAAENLRFFGRLYGLRGAELATRADWALGLAGLQDRRKDRAGTFSGGMKRRLNIAIALIHRPPLLILDEPTVGVDPQSRNHIFDWIEQLKSEGITLLYTTHYMEEAQRLCNRVAIVDHGQLLVVGGVAELLHQYGKGSVISGTIEHLPGNVCLPGVLSNRQWRYESEQPFEVMARLTSAGARFQDVQVSVPNLESVFLSLTGRDLRD